MTRDADGGEFNVDRWNDAQVARAPRLADERHLEGRRPAATALN